MHTETSTAKAVQIVVSGVPQELVEKIEKLAKRDNRSRAAQIRVLLKEIVEEREAELASAA